MVPGKRVTPPQGWQPPVKPQQAKTKLPPTPEQYLTAMMAKLKAGPGGANATVVQEYFEKIEQLIPTESVEDLPDRFVPHTKEEMDALASCIANFEAGGEAVRAFEPHGEAGKVGVPREKVDAPGDQDSWRQFPMPYGGKAGVPLEDLDKKYLYGLWANYEVSTEFKTKEGHMKSLKPDQIEKNKIFRAMLDLAGEHYQFKKKD